MNSKRSLDSDNIKTMDMDNIKAAITETDEKLNINAADKDKENILKMQHELAMLRSEVPKLYKDILEKERKIQYDQLKSANYEIMDNFKLKVIEKPSFSVSKEDISKKYDDIAKNRSKLNTLSENVFQCLDMISD